MSCLNAGNVIEYFAPPVIRIAGEYSPPAGEYNKTSYSPGGNSKEMLPETDSPA
jgi:hypothetical protein